MNSVTGSNKLSTIYCRPGDPPVYLCIATIVLLSATILIIGGKNARHVYSFKEADGNVNVSERGWTRACPARKRKGHRGSLGTVVAFYSGATWMAMPFAPAPVVLRYFAQHHPDFVVMNQLIRQEDGLAEALKKILMHTRYP